MTFYATQSLYLFCGKNSRDLEDILLLLINFWNLILRIHFYFQNSDGKNVARTNSFTQPTELKMGSITEVWKNGLEWQKFIDYLDKQPPEGVDSNGVPLKLSRYAKFLSLYVNLHYKEIQLKSSETRVSNHIRFTLISFQIYYFHFMFSLTALI